MAVKVGNNTVINDAKVLSVTGTSGTNCKYDTFYPNPRTVAVVSTVSMSFTDPVTAITLSQSGATITLADRVQGRTALLLLSTQQHTFSFSLGGGSLAFTGGTPDWSEYENWQIAFTCITSTTIRAVAKGWSAVNPPPPPPPPEPAIEVDFPNSPYVVDANGASFAGGGFAIAFLSWSGSTGQLSVTGTASQGVVTGAETDTWLIDGNASDYQVQWAYDETLNAEGTLTGPGSGWLDADGTYQWRLEDTSTGGEQNSVRGAIFLRRKSDQELLATGFVNLIADWQP